MAPTPIEFQKYLAGVDYPASKQDLIDTARRHHAPGDIVATLTAMQEDSFDGPTAVSEAVTSAPPA